jgi:peptidyl-tRNA hydrolase, PTH2 family
MSFEPNRDYLNSLINDLGISEKKAIKALKITNNTSIEAAASFVFDNLLDEKDDDDDDELNKFYSEELDRIQQTKEEGNIIEATTMIKMVFVINSSLKMNVGKIAAQVAHAAIDLYEESNSKQPALNVIWQQYGQTKIVLKGTDENELIELGNQAKQQKILTTLIHDAGRTQVPAGSLTCLGLFGRVNDIDKITGKLGLLKEC